LKTNTSKLLVKDNEFTTNNRIEIMTEVKILENLSVFLPIIDARAIELTIINCFGWIPRPLGTFLRGYIYRLIVASMGRSVQIHVGVEFLKANSIAFGDEVKILRDVHINMKPAENSLHIGNGVCIDRGVDIRAAGKHCQIEIGDRSYLGPYVCMAGPGQIKIGKECLIASQTGIYANNHREYGLSREGIEIQDNCWLGCGVRVLDGITIGRGSIIGAGAVVTKDIPPYSTAVGIPAKVIGSSQNSS
jgi:acetyltransferase-like isoleucine patch superfamily enzyme